MKQIALIIAVTLRLAACGNEEPKRVQIRPVRVTSVQHALSGDTISLTGQIQAKDPINLAFRVGVVSKKEAWQSLGYRQIIIESLEILKTIERSGEQRVEAAAWPFLLSLPAVHPMVYGGPTMFHGRVAVLPVVTIVAALQEGQFGFNFSGCTLRDSKSSYICNCG
jgi:hypothetical protein